ncbi:hypothetical protein AB1E18_018200 [Capra hircus]
MSNRALLDAYNSLHQATHPKPTHHSSRNRDVLARVLSRPPARPPPPQARPQDTVSRPARSRCSAAGPTGESGPRARASRRQHPGKRRRRRLLGPRHLGPRPGPAGSRLSGRAGPPPTDRPPDGQEGRQEEPANRHPPASAAPGYRQEPGLRHPPLARPPSSSSLEATLPNRRPPPAPPPLAPPRPARASTHSRSYRPAPPLECRPVNRRGRETGGARAANAAQSDRRTVASDATQSDFPFAQTHSCPGQQLSRQGREASLRGEKRNQENFQDETVSNTSDMAETKSMFREVLPKQGQLYVEDITTMVLCKPKLLPLKSLTLEKLEKMQQAAQDTIRQQEMTEKEQKITH